jgi:hypothetical protein
VKRVCFALVANRAIESKLSVAEWASCDIAIEGLCAIDEDHAYRAMDLLVEADAQAEVQEAVFFAMANLLNLEVDLLFFDTTSTYFERDTEETGDDGFRRYGHSKDNRDGLPRIVIGLALTVIGLALTKRASRSAAVLARQYQRPGDLARGPRRHPRLASRTGHHRGRPRLLQRRQPRLPAPRRWALHRRDAHARSQPAGRARARPAGPLPKVKENLRVKEVRLDDTDARFIICHNPEQANAIGLSARMPSPG